MSARNVALVAAWRFARRMAGAGAVLAMVLAGPAALATWVARPFDTVHAAGPSLLVAQAQTAAPRASALATSATKADVAIAILFTNGVLEVTALGRRLKIDNAAYQYLGGERVSVPTGAMGVLRVGQTGLIFLCGGSTSSFDMDAGRAQLSVERGTVRLITATGAATIRAGDMVVDGNADSGALFAAEVAHSGTELKVLPLAGSATTSNATLMREGGSPEIWKVKQQSAQAMGFPAALPPPQVLEGPVPALLGGGDYLCRTDELALVLAQNRAPPANVPVTLPPFLAPPGAPPLALATPDVADVFDPNALPAPAAGPSAPTVVVPAPSVAATGAGGGALATPE